MSHAEEGGDFQFITDMRDHATEPASVVFDSVSGGSLFFGMLRAFTAPFGLDPFANEMNRTGKKSSGRGGH